MNQLSITLPYIEESEVLLEDLLDQEALDLVVFNDDVNTFDHVIESLIKVCRHDSIQAEQCTLIIHYNGKSMNGLHFGRRNIEAINIDFSSGEDDCNTIQ